MSKATPRNSAVGACYAQRTRGARSGLLREVRAPEELAVLEVVVPAALVDPDVVHVGRALAALAVDVVGEPDGLGELLLVHAQLDVLRLRRILKVAAEIALVLDRVLPLVV